MDNDQSVDAEIQVNVWSVYVDGSSAQEGAREGILLIGPDNEEFKCSIKFTFLITNNAVKYEALLAGLRLARKIQVDRVKVFADSQLVVQQVIRGVRSK